MDLLNRCTFQLKHKLTLSPADLSSCSHILRRFHFPLMGCLLILVQHPLKGKGPFISNLMEFRSALLYALHVTQTEIKSLLQKVTPASSLASFSMSYFGRSNTALLSTVHAVLPRGVWCVWLHRTVTPRGVPLWYRASFPFCSWKPLLLSNP